jgi:hypothetical protein
LSDNPATRRCRSKAGKLVMPSAQQRVWQM